MQHKSSLNKFRYNYILVRKQRMDLFLNPKSIETVGKKKATALGNKCCILFVLKKEMVEFLFYEKETH